MIRPTISNIKLGWIQRFCAVAELGDFQSAAKFCNVDPTSLSDSVQRLEDCLCKPLIAPATSYLTASGRRFLGVAGEVMELSLLSMRPCTNVSIGWFQTLSLFSEYERYTDAAVALGWTRNKVMRNVSELENWMDDKLVYLDGGIRLTLVGERTVLLFKEKISLLEGFRGDPEVWYQGNMKRRKVPWWVRTFPHAFKK